MSGVNHVHLVGNVGKDPIIKYTQDGKAIANISIATSESWKDKNTGQKVEKTEWHRCNAFGKLAEIIGQFVKKGSKLYVEGSIHTRKWADQQGQDRWYSTEIKIREMQMLDSRNDEPKQQKTGHSYDVKQANNQYKEAAQKPQAITDKPFEDDLDIPF